MSFQVPQNVSSFSNPRQSDEDSYWRARDVNSQANGHTKGAKLNNFFADEADLPMYKDKPHFPARRKKGISPAIKVVGIIFVALLFFAFRFSILGGLGFSSYIGHQKGRSQPWLKGKGADWAARREAVKEAFVTSWDGYEKYAWGMDEYSPVSRKGKNMAPNGMGWIIVDALDTAMMMNLTSQVRNAREWMKNSLRFDADYEVNTFETTIRVLGGLLSAHYLSTTFPQLAPQADDDTNQPGEDLYLELATDLADRLLGAMDTNTGIPSASVNLNTSHALVAHIDGGASSTAEAATLQLEFKYVAKLTGEPLYWQKAEHIMRVMEANQREDGLVPIHIYPTTGEFRGQNIRLGSRGDSYYEYLIKQYLQTSEGEPIYLSMWEEALEGIKKHLIVFSKNSGLTVLAEKPNGLKKALVPKMDHLVCFLPGTIALGVTGGLTVADAKAKLGSKWTERHDENLRLAEELTRTCWAMYKATKTGLAPEIAHFIINDPPRMWLDWEKEETFRLELDQSEDAEWRMDVAIHELDQHNLQRPETVESLFYMWKITQSDVYRDWGWEMFESFMEHSAVKDSEGRVYGYTSLGNVNVLPAGKKRRDNMEGFWLAETLKYFWLLFGGCEELMGEGGGLGLDKVVINTEAHFLPRFELGRAWKTGWERTNPLFGGKTPEHQHVHEDGYEHGHIEENGKENVGEVGGRSRVVEVEGALKGLGEKMIEHENEHEEGYEHGHIEENGIHIV